MGDLAAFLRARLAGAHAGRDALATVLDKNKR